MERDLADADRVAYLSAKKAARINTGWYARRAAERRDRRFKVMQRLGGCCACCGERTLEFLSVDHVNGGGKKHRDGLAEQGFTFYLWILDQEDSALTGLRVLCHNCNQATKGGNICPHAYGPRLVGESDAG